MIILKVNLKQLIIVSLVYLNSNMIILKAKEVSNNDEFRIIFKFQYDNT